MSSRIGRFFMPFDLNSYCANRIEANRCSETARVLYCTVLNQCTVALEDRTGPDRTGEQNRGEEWGGEE